MKTLLAVVTLLVLTACGSEPSPAPTPTFPTPAPLVVPTTSAPPAPASVDVIKSEWRTLPTPMEGGKRTLEAACTVKITNTSPATLPVVWADISFDSQDGKTKLGSQPAGANQLMPGQSETVTVADWQIAPEKTPFTCRVASIR